MYERRRIAAAVLCPAAVELRVALCAVVKQRGPEAEIARDAAERICTDIDFHVNFPNRNKFIKNKFTYQVKSYYRNLLDKRFVKNPVKSILLEVVRSG